MPIDNKNNFCEVKIMTWERDTDECTCPKCGIKYEVEYQNLPVRDRDGFKCECGEKKQ